MFVTKSDGCDGVNGLHVGLLISAGATVSSVKYGRLWRRSLIVGFLIRCKKNPGYIKASRALSAPPSPPQSSSSYVPPPAQPDADELDGTTSVSQFVIDVGSAHEEIEEEEQQLLHNNEVIAESFNLEKRDDAGSVDQESSKPNGLRKLLSKVYSSVRSSSIKDHGDSSTPYVPLLQPPVEEQFTTVPVEVANSRSKDAIVRIVKEKDLPSLRKLGGVEGIASALGSDLDSGIASVRNPQLSNTNNPVYEKGFFHFLVEACNSFTILVLSISAGLSFAVEIIEKGLEYGWHDGTAILVAVFLLVIFPSVANFRRSRKILQMTKKMLEVKVVRGGHFLNVPVSDIVLGDVVHLKEGDIIPADGLFIKGNNFGLEAVLNSRIDRHDNPFLFSGSKVVEGEGCMLVTSEVAKSSLAEVLSLVKHDPNRKTLMEDRIDKPNSYIDNLALCVSVLIAVVVLVRLLFEKHRNDNVLPELRGKVSMKLLLEIFQRVLINPKGTISILTASLSAIVIGFQHGMPFVITISLSYWKKKFNFQAKHQNLSACCTIGIVTVICIEATCGLVYHEVEVGKFYIGDKEMNNDVEFHANPVVLEALRGLHMLVPEMSGSSIISWGNYKFQVNLELSDQSFDVIDYRNLSSNNRGIAIGVLMRKVGEDEETWHLHWKGPASMVLEMCSHYCDSGGESHAIENQKENFKKKIKDMEDSGLRPIAFAYRETRVQELRQDGLSLLALVGLKYQCREETKSTVEALKNCGIKIKLVSEDEVSVLRAIASELGFSRTGSNNALEGEEFRDMDIGARMQKLDQIDVIGSSISSDKLIVVQCLQKQGHVVAFFGGSTNDIPALIEADLGITHETLSSEMARESCDIVILGSGLGLLDKMTKSSRRAYKNIQKFTQVQLCSCISGLLLIFISTIILKDSPLAAIQLIWVNIVTFTIGCPMMVLEIQHEELSTDRLDTRFQSLITKDKWINIAIQVLCQASVLMIFLFLGQTIFGINKNVVQAMIFNTFVLCQVFNQFNAIDLIAKHVFIAVAKSYSILIALGGVIVMEVLVIEFGTSLANFPRLNKVQWAFCFLIASLSWVLDCAVKLVLIAIPN